MDDHLLAHEYEEAEENAVQDQMDREIAQNFNEQ